MKRLLGPALAAGIIAAGALPVPAVAQDEGWMYRRAPGPFTFEGRAFEGRQGWGRDVGREAYDRGYRQGRMDERRASGGWGRGYGYGSGYGYGGDYGMGPYGWSAERFGNEGLFGGLFNDREMEFED